MNVGELFIQLGLKGTDVVFRGLKTANEGMEGLASSSLAAKAAVAGVIVGLERLTGYASQVGMDLNKFAITTGLSTDELQKWEYAAMHFDVTGQEMQGTIKGIQNAMSDMLLGKGAPDALGILADKVGFDTDRSRDTFYVLGKLQEFAKTQPPDIANNLLKSFGISDNVFQMLKASNLEVDKLAKKDFITKDEIARLTLVNKAWKDFWFTLKTLGVKTVAAEGIGAVRELADAFKLLVDAGRYILDLTEKFKLLKYAMIAIGAAIAIYFAPFTALIAGLTLLLADFEKLREGKKSVTGEAIKSVATHAQNMRVGQEGERSARAGGALAEWIKSKMAPEPKPQLIGPVQPQGAGQTVMNNTFHFDGKEPEQNTIDAFQRIIQNAGRQYNSQVLQGG